MNHDKRKYLWEAGDVTYLPAPSGDPQRFAWKPGDMTSPTAKNTQQEDTPNGGGHRSNRHG